MGKVVYLMNVSLDGLVERNCPLGRLGKVDDEVNTWFGDRQREADVSVSAGDSGR